MDPLEAATESGDAIGGLGAHFMLDMNTYVYGAEIGFGGADFYVAGRGGALGEVPAGVVVAAFVFWNPDHVAAAWERSAEVMSRAHAAAQFAAVAHRWADEHVPDDFDSARLADLAGRLGDAASVSCAPLFAGWRALPEPSEDHAKALVIHRLNALRELRGALHGAAVVAQGIHPHAAVARRTPFMLDVFGWPEPHPDKDPVREPWDEAQRSTERAIAHIYEALDPTERAEFVELANSLQTAVTGA